MYATKFVNIKYVLMQVKGNYCTDCVNFFGDLREIFNNSEVLDNYSTYEIN